MEAAVRVRNLLSARAPLLVTLPCCVAAFLLIVAFGAPSRALGLDPSWTEVLAWGFLHHAQWGRDLIFTYGPLGFLQPYASYVDGIFAWYMAGAIALPAGFALSIALLFRRGSIALFALFALVYLAWCSRLSGDVSWALTLLFGTGYLIGGRERMSALAFHAATITLALVFAMIALAKFSLFPLWLLCTAAVVTVNLFAREPRRALVAAIAFLLALVLAWVACRQELLNLPLFLLRSFDVARGYPHAMGLPAPPESEHWGLGLSGAMLGACFAAAWFVRADRAALVALALCAATTILFWLAFFTRGDHWPWFFPAIALLVFVPLCNERLAGLRGLRPALVLIALVATAMTSAVMTPRTIVADVGGRMRNNVFSLTHLGWMKEQRDRDWQRLVREAALPRIRARVRDARIDLLTWEQGIVLINGLHYAPRPVFQSYSAYTSSLARLNEAYFLGPDAPEYVALRLDAVDGRVPMSEDGLAMLALLRRYRPLFVEKRFLLLQRDVLANAEPLPVPEKPIVAHFGESVPVAAPAPAVVSLDVGLSTFGKFYTLLFREPAVQIVLTGADGKDKPYRLVRATASDGFLLQPMLLSIVDWIRLYLGKPVAQVSSLRIDTEHPWERWLFRPEYRVGLQALPLLGANGQELAELSATLLYPGFNEAPVAPTTELRVVPEGDEDVVFLHAPSTLTFRPAPGRYAISAIYGVQANAVADAGCVAAHADGVGVSLVLRRANLQSVLAHMDINPFRDVKARGPQRLNVANVDIAAGDEIDYRVDPGQGGQNIACDWSYVRDLVFKRRLESPANVAAAYPGFNVAPMEAGLHVSIDDGKPSVFVHAPGTITFAPAPGRYAFSATYGLQNVAVDNEGCIRAGANGIGVSLVLQHAGAETVLAHEEIDPFATARDRGPHTLRVPPFDVGLADKVQYRVDGGHGGKNISCDWSYVRDAVLQRTDRPRPAAAAPAH